MTLNGIIFDNSLFSPFVVGFVRSKASILTQIFYVVVINEVVKGGVIDLIGRRHTKNWMILCESHQY